ncbi:MAG: TetR/AcrR family transcriptional regulator C-terminal domain-containing protein [Gammaproteobacteria bacterium]
MLGTTERSTSEFKDPVTGLKTIARAVVDLIYAPESLKLYRLIIAELSATGSLKIPDVAVSSRQFMSTLKEEEHFRCLLGMQPGLNDAEKEDMIDAAVSLFLKGHGYEA